MRDAYAANPTVRATLNVIELNKKLGWYMVSSIEVAPAHRGRGYASTMLRAVCEDADREGVLLTLAVAPQGFDGLTYEQLLAWYERYGFKGTALEAGVMERKPRCGLPVEHYDRSSL
jgi:GNAT superfamily N-acetyltransferase